MKELSQTIHENHGEKPSSQGAKMFVESHRPRLPYEDGQEKPSEDDGDAMHSSHVFVDRALLFSKEIELRNVSYAAQGAATATRLRHMEVSLEYVHREIVHGT